MSIGVSCLPQNVNRCELYCACLMPIAASSANNLLGKVLTDQYSFKATSFLWFCYVMLFSGISLCNNIFPAVYRDLCALTASRRASSSSEIGRKSLIARPAGEITKLRKIRWSNGSHHGYRDSLFGCIPRSPSWLYQGSGCWTLITWMGSLRRRQTFVSSVVLRQCLSCKGGLRIERRGTETAKRRM